MIKPASQIAAFRSLVQEPSVKVVSVDVFDTLLLRTTTPEVARFHAIAQLWADALDAARQPRPSKPTAITALRLLAQRTAYYNTPSVDGCREANHGEILRVVLHGLGLPDSWETRFAELELAYEARVLAPNAALAQVLHEARQQGKRVVATSDMYLSSAAIHRLVAEKLPTPPLDTIYVSSEQRINKASGALYAFVAQREGAETQEIAHCGDNHGSDVAQAHAAGIRAVHTPRPTIWHWRRRCKTRAFLTAHPELRTA